MPEAMIVATARTPIGRANKGSLVECRPDDLSALDREGRRSRRCRHSTPRWSRTCSGATASPPVRPGTTSPASSAILAGIPQAPGVTVNRYCSSSLQTIRMAAHAIKAGEGDVFVAGGVGDGQPLRQGHVRRSPRHAQRRLRRGRGAHDASATKVVRATGRRLAASPTCTSRWARRPRTSPSTTETTREEMDEFAARSQNRAVEAQTQRLLRAGDHAGHVRRRHRRSPRTTARVPTPRREAGGAEAGVPARRHRHGRATPAR